MYGQNKRISGEAFHILLEGVPLDGVAQVTEHINKWGNGYEDLRQLDIELFDASKGDLDLIMSMKALSDTGTNFVRIGVNNCDPDAPPDELATAFALMGEEPMQYEGMVLREVRVTHLAKARMNVKIVALQLFKPNKEVSP